MLCVWEKNVIASKSVSAVSTRTTGRDGSFGGNFGRGRGGNNGGGGAYDLLACFTRVGCMAIWLVTVPNPGHHKVLVLIVLKMHNRSNLGAEAQGEVERGRSGLEVWV